MEVKPHATQLYIETSEFRQQLQAWSNSTTESMRSELALSPSWPVRHITAKHSLTPVFVLAQLAYDQNYLIRNAVAANHNTLPEHLLFLAQDQLVAETIAKKSINSNRISNSMAEFTPLCCPKRGYSTVSTP